MHERSMKYIPQSPKQPYPLGALCIVQLLLGVQCNHWGFRKIPQEVSPSFTCTLAARQAIVYLKEEKQGALILTITSGAQTTAYHLQHWQVLAPHQGTMNAANNAPLRYGDNTLTYQPQTIGQHVIQVTVATDTAMPTKQTAQCTLTVKQAQHTPYKASLQADQANILASKRGTLSLHIHSKEQQAACLDYVLKHWEVTRVPRCAGDHLQGKLYANPETHRAISEDSPLDYGPQTLYYAPQGDPAGTYTLWLTLENEQGDQQKISTKIQVTQASYTLTGMANAAGELTLYIEDAPAAFAQDLWTLIEKQWSQGLQGRCLTRSTQLHYGENTLKLCVDAMALTAPPLLWLKIQGPDKQVNTVSISLREVCIAQLGATLKKQEEALGHHLSATKQAREKNVGPNHVAAKQAKCERLQLLLKQSNVLQEECRATLTGSQQSLCHLSTGDASPGYEQAVRKVKPSC